MLEGKAMIEDTDMPLKMQIQAMASASQALDHYDVVDCKSIAAHIKKVLFLSQSLSKKVLSFIVIYSFLFFACFFLLHGHWLVHVNMT